MKSRRLTVVCMAAIALAGTPRAWQEISNLLSAAQQKAQLKFWSMVMRPNEPAEVELIAVAEEVNYGHGVSPCSEERDWTRGNFEAVSYKQVRRAANPAAPRPKTYARRRPAEATGLIAHARKAPAAKDGVERRIKEKKEKKDFDFDFSEVAENLPAPKPAPHTHPVPVDTLTFIQVPTVAPVAAAAFSEKEVAYQFKLLRKTLNENKLLLRQRGGRLPAVRVSAFPAS